jgi:hypothetical protein
MEDVQATGEACSPQKRSFNTSKHESSLLFLPLRDFFAVRIQPTKINADTSGSASTTLELSLSLNTICMINDNDKILYFPSCTVTNILHIYSNIIHLGMVVRHVTGNDKDYLRKIPRVVW